MYVNRGAKHCSYDLTDDCTHRRELLSISRWLSLKSYKAKPTSWNEYVARWRAREQPVRSVAFPSSAALEWVPATLQEYAMNLTVYN